MVNVGDRVQLIDTLGNPHVMEVGDRVELISPYGSGGPAFGSIGTVVVLRKYDMGIQWDDFHNGHNCNRSCEGDSGWYVPYNMVRPLATEEEDIQIDAETMFDFVF